MTTLFEQRQLMKQVDDITSTEQMIVNAFNQAATGVATLRTIRATWGTLGTEDDLITDADRTALDNKITLYTNKVLAASSITE